MPLCRKKSMFDILSVLKTRRRYVNSGRLLADRILQHIGSERSDPIREMHFLTFFCFFAFSNLRRVRGFRPSPGGPNYATCRCVEKKSVFAFLSVWKTRRRYANSGRLLADHILQQIGRERSDSIREMHFWTFSVFLCFQT